MVGKTLSHYEILEQLGAGGMGEVYRAKDTRLDRDVAVKVLPTELAEDPERLARLQQEARLLATLEHPNIATVYGLEEAGSVQLLVMQLAQGETLADRIAGAALSIPDVIEIARQVATGLESAHEAGVIHRDLKPANVMVGPAGDVKILDFGLAKATGPSSVRGATDMTASPTMMAVTSAGMIMGTAAYMSPEQARGKPVDRRTDVWSFGVVLYEMLTGSKAFDEETVTDVMAAIVTRDPDWDRLPAAVPPRVERLLRRCLDKDPRQRLRDIGEARIALSDAEAPPGPERSDAAEATFSPVGRLGWVVAGVLALAAATLGWQQWNDNELSPAPSYVAIPATEVRFAADYDGGQVAVSPDGRSLAISGHTPDGQGVWVRRLAEPIGRRLEGVTGWEPGWSPDGQEIALTDYDTLRVHDLRTGATSVRYRSQGLVETPAWSEDGRLYFSETLARSARIMEALPGGDVRVVTNMEGIHAVGGGLRIHALGDDRFLTSRWSPEHGHVDTSIVLPDGRLDEPLLHLDAAVELAPPDILLFARDGALWAQRLDVDAGTLATDAVALLAQVDSAPGNTPWLSVGGNTLSYRTGVGQASPTVLELVDREGALIDSLVEADNYYDPRIAPDGLTMVFDLSTAGDAGDIWLASPDGTGIRLTSLPADETRPVWSPDGSRIVLETTRENTGGRLFIRDVESPVENLVPVGADPLVEEPTDWAGGTIVGNSNDAAKIWIVDAETGASRLYRDTAFRDYGASLAPDGSHVVYVSDESGRPEIWVDTFPDPSDRRRISSDGGTTPVWRRDGREILYHDRSNYVTSIEVISTSPLQLGAPTRLFQASLREHEIRQFDVSPDGERLLVNRLVELPDLPVRLLIGWREVLAERVPEGW